MKNKKLILGILAIVLAAIVVGAAIYRRKLAPEITSPQIKITPSPTIMENFCGSSSLGKCAVDKDCLRGGCSGQACLSKNEKSRYTTCEWRDCYEAKKYGLECKCIDKTCQWAKI
jgi:eight-cysteine-cluster-containing protein